MLNLINTNLKGKGVKVKLKNIGNFSGIDQFFEIAGFELARLYCTFKKKLFEFLGFTQDEKHTVSTRRGKHTSKICL